MDAAMQSETELSKSEDTMQAWKLPAEPPPSQAGSGKAQSHCHHRARPRGRVENLTREISSTATITARLHFGSPPLASMGANIHNASNQRNVCFPVMVCSSNQKSLCKCGVLVCGLYG
eukprot:scaffold111378_cov30-Prasinocladus_malaysianus.AAC.2